MKKKIVAWFTMMAMVCTLLPATAFAHQVQATAASDIEINVFSFNNEDVENGDILIYVTGKGVHKNSRITCILDGVSEPLYSGILTKNGENEIKIPKNKIPDIMNPYAANRLNITISNAAGNQILATDTFTPNYVASTPEIINMNIKDGSGVKGRQISVAFDSGFYPGDADEIQLQGIDVNGKDVGKVQTTYITNSKLATEVNNAALRELTNPITCNFDEKAVKVRGSFWRDGKELKAFTTIMSLAPRYGALKELQLVFNDTHVHRGETVEGKLWYVNTKGDRYDITGDGLYIYSDSPAIASKNNYVPQLTIAKDAAYGSKISITAYYGSDYSKLDTVELTVDEALPSNGLKFSSNSGKADQDLSIDIQLVDEKGNNKVLNFAPTEVAAHFVNTDGKTNNFKFIARNLSSLNKNGTMSAILENDTPCKGNVEIIFSDDKGNKYKATGAFTFTDPKAKEDKTAIFTIGSTNVLVNGVSKTIEVAPFITQNRTFVPLRAVNESMGASVDWNDSKREITIKDDDKVIVMHPGSVNYTINGKAQKPMDVAPYIASASGRTIVPLRFVIEALDYDVEPVYNPNGTTAKVIISNK